MPKPGQVLKKVKEEAENFAKSVDNKFEHVLHDKDERTEDCFRKLQEAQIKLCFANTGAEITSYDQIKDINIDRINPFTEKVLPYCLEELAKHGVIECSKATLHSNTISGIPEGILHEPAAHSGEPNQQEEL